jgi:outer membrane protein TolC
VKPALLLGLSLLALAARAADAELPPDAQVRAALESHPAVLAARAGVSEREAAGRALEAGTYELNLRLAAHNRRERASGQDLPEYGVELERAWRSGRKAELDAQLGRQGVARARLAVGDAIHEAARELLRAWFDWLRAAAQGEDWEAQAGLLERESQAVERRVSRGDAPAQERLLAESAFEQAKAQALLAQAKAGAVAAQLAAAFPAISVPASPPTVELRPVEGDLRRWRALVLEHNHELAVARAESRRVQLVAQRADANRVPDPTLGMRLSSERDGAERVVGFSLALPLPGEARAAAAEGAVAESAAASQREASVLRRLEGQTAALYAFASRSYEAARRADNAALGLRRNAELSSRAYALRAINLAEAVAAGRLAIEARLAATLAKLDAAEARYRLMLDAHELWPVDAP